MRMMHKITSKVKRFFRRGEPGFAMVVVLIALLMLSVLGAASLLLMVSSMQGMANLRPEDRAFQVAESGLYVAHAKIVNNEIEGSTLTLNDNILGGQYTATVDRVGGSRTHYVITSLGTYMDGDNPYRRKIQEDVYYSGDQAFDALRNYVLFAGRDINFNFGEFLNLNLPVRVNGDIRAERDVNVNFKPILSAGDGLTFNGDIEGKRSVNIVDNPTSEWFGGANVNVYGDIKTGDATNPSGQGSVYLETGGSLFVGCTLNAACTATYKWNIYYSTLVERKLDSKDKINKGNLLTGQRGCLEVYVPQPDLAYYKALAQKQGHYYPGDATISPNLGAVGTSSETVYYVAGNLTLGNTTWTSANLKGVFVCEGNFYTSSSTDFRFRAGSKFQVIAGKDIDFKNRWSFNELIDSVSCEYFFFAGNNLRIQSSMFAGQKLQATALNDLTVYTDAFDFFNLTEINYLAPNIDISGWPIDVTVTNWRELPAD